MIEGARDFPAEELEHTHAAVARSGVRLRTSHDSVVATFGALGAHIQARSSSPGGRR